ncbi:MAG: hypothetical protein ACRC6A_12930 [Fusobacteriaceae bacterium]
MTGAGWNLKKGEVNPNNVIETAIYHFFSKGNQMQNLYKLSLFKSLIDIEELEGDVFNEIAVCFSEIYFNYKKEYPINIVIYNGRSKKSTMDILIEKFYKEGIYSYEKIPIDERIDYIILVRKVLKTNVTGAFYKSLKELPYNFNIKEETLILNIRFKEFINKNKNLLEKIIQYRIIEFLKVSEKDKDKLKREIPNYEQDFYIQIKDMLNILFK